MAEQTWRTPEAVRAWLEQQPAGAVVGHTGCFEGCTLSNCYKALGNHHEVGVTARIVSVWGDAVHDECLYPTTEFEQRFLEEHDATDKFRPNRPVTRERALEILNQIAPVAA